jgi:Flp pilus assembly protein TadG
MNTLIRLIHDKWGNFGILTALMLVPLIGAAGMAIDFGRAMSLRSHLMGLADSAALGAISETSPGFIAIREMKRDGRIQLAEDEGRNLFLSQRANASGEDLPSFPMNVAVNVQRSNGAISSTVDFNVQMPTTFMRILGQEGMSIAGSATAVYGSQAKSYTDFYMLLDNTPSMGIAATTKDIAKFQQITKGNGQRGCEFACHIGWTDSSGKFNEDKNSSYLVARANGITLRIDVVAKAAEALIERVKTEMGKSADYYRVAAYSFGKYALENGYRIERVLASTSNMDSASSAVGKVGLQTTNHDHYHQNALTSFDNALTEIGKQIPGKGGEGTSLSDTQKVVYFVTDGVGDGIKSSGCGGSWYENKGRCLEPIDNRFCADLKNRQIKIAILYTTYIPPEGDHIWETYMEKKFGSRIASSLQTCASEDLFFEVGPDDDMEEAMAHLFVKAASSYKNLRLAF